MGFEWKKAEFWLGWHFCYKFKVSDWVSLNKTNYFKPAVLSESTVTLSSWVLSSLVLTSLIHDIFFKENRIIYNGYLYYLLHHIWGAYLNVLRHNKFLNLAKSYFKKQFTGEKWQFWHPHSFFGGINPPIKIKLEFWKKKL